MKGGLRRFVVKLASSGAGNTSVCNRNVQIGVAGGGEGNKISGCVYWMYCFDTTGMIHYAFVRRNCQ
jgi:hypothetical protein